MSHAALSPAAAERSERGSVLWREREGVGMRNPRSPFYTKTAIGLDLGRLGPVFFRNGPSKMPATVNIYLP